MDRERIETERLILRGFSGEDLEDIYALLADEEVNRFLPWFPLKDRQEAAVFCEQHLKGRYCYAICLKDDDRPIGYLHMEESGAHDFGYALQRRYWHQGIVTEAGKAFIELLKTEGIPFFTATHDRNNERSGRVMQRLGMRYCYSYKEQWQPKDFPVIFRMYQMNLDGNEDQVYDGYWNRYEEHFIEELDGLGI